MSEDERIIRGRTYIETLILTLTQIEFQSTDPDVLFKIASRLEVEICALSVVMPELHYYYAMSLRQLIKTEFGRDIALPDELFDRCSILAGILEYLSENPKYVLEGRFTTTDALARIKTVLSRIAISAIHATFYRAGMIRIS